MSEFQHAVTKACMRDIFFSEKMIMKYSLLYFFAYYYLYYYDSHLCGSDNVDLIEAMKPTISCADENLRFRKDHQKLTIVVLLNGAFIAVTKPCVFFFSMICCSVK